MLGAFYWFMKDKIPIHKMWIKNSCIWEIFKRYLKSEQTDGHTDGHLDF